MKTILNFIDTWGIRIMFLLIIVVFLKTCTTNSKIKNESDKIEILSKKLDSTNKAMNDLSTDLQIEIKIEGLRAEKRMIQSTDRKLLDVNRQSEIDKELSKIDK